MIEFDDMELMQLKFCMDQTKNQMSMGERFAAMLLLLRNASRMEKRKNDSDRDDYVRRQVIDQIKSPISN